MVVQYQYPGVVNEYNAMVYVKRRNTFHLDSSPDLFGELGCTTYPTSPDGPVSSCLSDAVFALVVVMSSSYSV